MDKFEYNIRANEIKALIQEGNFAEAAAIADTIDWGRVKSIMMLCTVSDVYKINRRYKESKDILSYAYDRNPGGRLILYHLCELSLKLGEFVQALEYYKEFCRVAPKDNSRYILQYKIYEAQDVSLEERIAVLEELKKREYKEKWAYELAYLYHRVGLATKCAEECDEIFLWFGKGKYVIKALELKQLHVPLTEDQGLRLAEAKPENRYGELGDYGNDTAASADEELMADDAFAGEMSADGDFPADGFYTEEEAAIGYGAYEEEGMPGAEMYAGGRPAEGEYAMEGQYSRAAGYPVADQYSTTAGYPLADQYSTTAGYPMADQYSVAAGYPMGEGVSAENLYSMEDREITAENASFTGSHETDNYVNNSDTKEYPYVGKFEPSPKPEEMSISVKPVDVSQYNTINLQQVVAESMKEILSDNAGKDSPAAPSQPLHNAPVEAKPSMEAKISMEEKMSMEAATNNKTEVFFGDTADLPVTQEKLPIDLPEPQTSDSPTAAAPEKSVLTNTGVIKAFNKVSGYDQILTQEYDGQIGLVMPDEKKVEKQITGQLKIVDILAEWQRQKKEIEEKRKEEIRIKVRKQTDVLFADYDEATKTGLLEKLEKAMVDAALRGDGRHSRPSVIKVADISAEGKTAEGAARESHLLEPEDEEVQRLLAMDDEIPEADDDDEMAPLENTLTVKTSSAAEGIAAETASLATETTPTGASSLTAGTAAGAIAGAASLTAGAVTGATAGAASLTARAASDAASLASGTAARAASPIAETTPTGTASQTSGTAVTGVASPATPATAPGTASAQDNPDGDPAQPVFLMDPVEPAQSASAVRELNDDEKARFGRFVQHKKTRRQLLTAIENISLAAYTGNVIVTGEEGIGTMKVAKELIKGVQQSDDNFSGRVAKISGETLNKKDVAATFSKLENGAVIVEKASDLKPGTVTKLLKVLEQENTGYIVILEDQKAAANQLVERHPELVKAFNLRVDLEALDDQSLVAFASKYALEQEYTIDDLGILALHTRIADLQTIDHEVTVAEVQEIVEEAIYYADKKNPKHFFDILIGKRYDREDMIILRENDFMHY